jgi:hypothetical protein
MCVVRLTCVADHVCLCVPVTEQFVVLIMNPRIANKCKLL